MDRTDRDPPTRESRYANTAEVSPQDRPALQSATGREAPAEESQDPIEQARDEEIREKGVGARPVSERTDFRTSGTGAIETEDGLDETGEQLRHTAEDIPDENLEPRPVFDRGR